MAAYVYCVTLVPSVLHGEAVPGLHTTSYVDICDYIPSHFPETGLTKTCFFSDNLLPQLLKYYVECAITQVA